MVFCSSSVISPQSLCCKTCASITDPTVFLSSLRRKYREISDKETEEFCFTAGLTFLCNASAAHLHVCALDRPSHLVFCPQQETGSNMR